MRTPSHPAGQIMRNRRRADGSQGDRESSLVVHHKDRSRALRDFGFFYLMRLLMRRMLLIGATFSFFAAFALVLIHECRALQDPAKQSNQTNPVTWGRPLSYWMEKFRSDDSYDRREALEAISLIATRAKGNVEAVLPVLIKATKDSNWTNRCSAVLTIERMGNKAKGAGPGLIEALQDEDDSVRSGAANALG